MIPKIEKYDFVVYDYGLCVPIAKARLQMYADEDNTLKELCLRGVATHLSHHYGRDVKVVFCNSEGEGVRKSGEVLYTVRHV